MADPAGEADGGALRLDFYRRVMLRFHGSAITSDGGLLAYRELDDVLALTTSGGERLAEARAAEPWSLTSLREKLIKIGAKVVSHGRYTTFQMAEVAVRDRCSRNF